MAVEARKDPAGRAGAIRALNPHIGYTAATRVAAEALAGGRGIRAFGHGLQ